MTERDDKIEGFVDMINRKKDAENIDKFLALLKFYFSKSVEGNHMVYGDVVLRNCHNGLGEIGMKGQPLQPISSDNKCRTKLIPALLKGMENVFEDDSWYSHFPAALQKVLHQLNEKIG